MKKTDAQLIISAVGRAVRKLFDPMKEQVIALSEKLTQAETVIAAQRETIEKLSTESAQTIAGFAERVKTLEDYLVHLKNNPPTLPTLDEIVAKIHIVAPPSAEDVAAVVLRDLPIDTIAAKARETIQVPTAKEVADAMPAPVIPTAEEIAKLVVVPTAEEVAKHVPVPAVPTIDEIVKRVPIPELPHIELPELPQVPTLDEILAGVKELLPQLIPAPIKGDAGKSVTIDDVRPLIERLIAELPKPQDGKSLSVDDVRPLFAEWALDFERRAVARHDQVIANLPKPKDGVDGLGFENFDATVDMDSKTLRFVFSREGVEPKSFEFFIPWLNHKGVYRAADKYLQGDCVTRGGHTWMAVKTDPAGEPMDGASNDWRMIVRRGSDGRDATPKQTTPSQVRVAPRNGG